MTDSFWIRTASGKKFDYPLGSDNDVDIFDIAEHLSKIPRFAGACRPNLSVAQHSVAVSALMERDGGGPIAGLVGLFHDAHEAYFGDIPTPFTDYLFALTGQDIKERVVAPIDAAVFRKLNIDYPLDDAMYARLKTIDAGCFAAEGVQLVKGFKVPEGCPVADIKVTPVGQEQAYRSFLERYNKLTTLRQRMR